MNLSYWYQQSGYSGDVSELVMKILVAYSGGKDSQACLIWAIKEYGVNKIEAVFCDTGWEHPITYDHITKTCNDLKVKLTTVQSKKYDGMVDLATKKKRFPSVRARFCTSELKLIPFIDYVLSQDDHCLIIQGIRASESSTRALMSKQCAFFKFYYEPYNIDPKTNLLKIGKNGKRQKPKKHTYRKKDVFKFKSKYSDDILRPVFDWTGIEVMKYIIKNGQKPNDLYYEGFKRVGCFPCIMSSHTEIRQIMDRYSERFLYIKNLEIELNSSFFKIDHIPKRFRTGIDSKSGKRYTRAVDLEKYLTDKNRTLNLYENPKFSCSSYYHLCE